MLDSWLVTLLVGIVCALVPTVIFLVKRPGDDLKAEVTRQTANCLACRKEVLDHHLDRSVHLDPNHIVAYVPAAQCEIQHKFLNEKLEKMEEQQKATREDIHEIRDSAQAMTLKLEVLCRDMKTVLNGKAQ